MPLPPPEQHRRDAGDADRRRLCRRPGAGDRAFLSLKMKRPLFLEGEAGVGKTEIAKVLASALGRRLIRLQCYEGLDRFVGGL
jgi:MoxR-like ATPase